jgi:signal transduction histidine kinase
MGSITASSRLGEGTTFMVTMPAIQPKGVEVL